MVILMIIIFSTEVNATSVPQVWNVPTENRNFVGRENLLDSIEKFFKSGNSKIAVVSGYSGFGKTQIAKRYAYRNYSNYDVVWWFKGNQYLEPQFENFALALDLYLGLGVSDKIKTIGHSRLISIVKDALRKKDVKCLIIFDDVQTFKKIEAYIPFSHEKNIHILITTKNESLSDHPFRTQNFQRTESLEYIQRLLPNETEEECRRLANHFSDCPSSLALSIDYISNFPGMTIKNYLLKHASEAEFSPQYLAEASQRFGSTLDGYELDLFRAVKMNLTELQNSSKLAFSLIGFLSLLHHDAITTGDIQKWLNEQQSDKDALELLNMLNKSSLLDIANSSDGQGNLRMHELIQKISSTLIPVDEKKKQIEIAINVLEEAFAGRTDEMAERVIKCNSPLLHAIKISTEAYKISYHSPKLTSFRTKIFDLLVGHVRDYEQSKMLAEHLNSDLQNKEKLSKVDEFRYNGTMFLYNFVFSPDYKTAIIYGKKALELIESEEGMFEEKVRLYANLLQYCSLAGELENSHMYIEKGNSCLPRSESSAYNALYIFAVSMFHNDCCEYDKTIELIKANKPLLSKQDSYPSIRFFVLNQFAEALAKKGDVAKSLEALAQAEKLGREYYPNEDNSFFGKWYALKAACQISNKETYSLAQKSLTKSLKIYEKVYSGTDKHRNQAFAHFMMGKLHYLKRQYVQSKEHFLQSDQIYDRLLKHKKIEEISQLYKFLAVLGVDLKDETLTHIYLRKHVDIFGVDHHNSNEIMIYLDSKGLVLPF